MKLRKGFTLVELLIVIVIIGILAGTMLLSSTGTTALADKTKIVADLRSGKAAALMWYIGNVPSADAGWMPSADAVGEYMDNGRAFAATYKIVNKAGAEGPQGGEEGWWITTKNTVRTDVVEHLQAGAQESGLVQGTTEALYTAGNPYVKIR